MANQRKIQWIALLCLIALACITLGVNIHHTVLSKQIQEKAIGPGEGYYWSASQYRYGFQRFFIQLYAYQKDHSVVRDFDVSFDVLLSKHLVLIRTVTPQLKNNVEYKALLQTIDAAMLAIQQRYPAMLTDPQTLSSVIKIMKDTSPVVSQVVMAAYAEETRLRELSIQHSRMLEKIALITLIIVSITLAIFFIREWGLIRDNQQTISLQKQTIEAARKAKEDALEMALARSSLLSTVSHEILTPLHTILAGIEMLEEDHVIQSTATSRIVGNIGKATQHLFDMVQDLLELSRLGMDSIKLKPTQVKIHLWMENTINEFQISAQAKRLDLNYLITPSVSEIIVLDFIRFKQILSNLLVNAIRYTDQGEINVTLDLLTEKTKLPTLLLTVQDSGIGIAEKYQKHIFDIFNQGANHQRGGAGLGLAIVSKLVGLMQGSISLVSSQEGNGSTFCVQLPCTVISDPVSITAVNT